MSKYPSAYTPTWFSLRTLVEECVFSSLTPSDADAVRAVIDVPAGQTIVADREWLFRAVRNLVRAALAAMPNGGTLEITSAAGHDAVELEIADSGDSLSDEALAGAFEPNESEHRGTTGWALAGVRRAAELHGGNVTVANCPDGGVAFTLLIPQSAALEAAA